MPNCSLDRVDICYLVWYLCKPHTCGFRYAATFTDEEKEICKFVQDWPTGKWHCQESSYYCLKRTSPGQSWICTLTYAFSARMMIWGWRAALPRAYISFPADLSCLEPFLLSCHGEFVILPLHVLLIAVVYPVCYVQQVGTRQCGLRQREVQSAWWVFTE